MVAVRATAAGPDVTAMTAGSSGPRTYSSPLEDFFFFFFFSAEIPATTAAEMAFASSLLVEPCDLRLALRAPPDPLPLASGF